VASLLLVRHGQALFGQADYDGLSAIGTKQGELLGQWLAQRDTPIHQFYHGGLKRHELTLEALQNGYARPAFIKENGALSAFSEYRHQEILTAYDPGLMKRWNEEFEKTNRIDWADFRHHFRAALRLWIEGALPTNEPFAAFKQRVVDGLASLSKQVDDQQTILIVTSGGVISLLLSEIMHIPSLKAFETGYGFYNCGLSEIRRFSNQWSLSGLNQIAHIEITNQKHLITTL
jgi:broad specificity phosphatase PhoE